ncbi:NYN domain-containing protein [Roseibacillus persicicus]|uniref:NYN domain-containing protein n=1 Tax=Roseibacillus persicicus TaxID=454148 RepID=UPI00398A52E2
MDGQLLIVDGHNALMGLKRFAQALWDNPADAREQLVDWLSRYQSSSDDAVVVVFDGKGNDRNVYSGDEGEAMVIYASSQETADAVVEQLAASQGKKRSVVVATNDRSVQLSVIDSGAEALSLEAMEMRVELLLDTTRKNWNVQSG